MRSTDPANSELLLISNYKDTGDLQVLGNLYRPYMEQVYGVCLKYLQIPEDAQDAVSNIFEELILKVKKYEIDNFGGWLYMLAKNHCLMRLRKLKSAPRNVEFTVMHSAQELHQEDILEKENSLNGLEECLETLNAEQKNAVSLFYLQGKCYKEIEQSTGLDANKVRSQIQNGRRNLKICMEEKANEQT